MKKVGIAVWIALHLLGFASRRWQARFLFGPPVNWRKTGLKDAIQAILLVINVLPQSPRNEQEEA